MRFLVDIIRYNEPDFQAALAVVAQVPVPILPSNHTADPQTKAVLDMMYACLQEDPADRPSGADIAAYLREFQRRNSKSTVQQR